MAHNSVTDPEGFPQNAPTSGAEPVVKNCLFGLPSFTDFALIENILRKISAVYKKSTSPSTGLKLKYLAHSAGIFLPLSEG